MAGPSAAGAERTSYDSVNVRQRLDERARAWGVTVERVSETETSVLAFGCRGTQAVVLKVLKCPGDEWRSGEVLRALDGRGVVRLHEYVEGAMLVERLAPGYPLTGAVLDGRDDDAVDVLADVIHQMGGPTFAPGRPTVLDWAKAFHRYVPSRDSAIPADLVEEGHRRYLALAASQRQPRLLHGDLHQSNVLFDSARGWCAVDPKGVIGETEFEIGAVLRNPIERPDLFASSAIVERRLTRFARRLGIDCSRALEWGFAQAVLSAIWSIEDGFTVDARTPALRLANAIRPLLG